MALSSLEEYLDREFGALPNAERRARVTLDEAPQIRANAVLNQDTAEQQAIPEWTGPQQAPEEGNWDRTRVLGAGVADLAESVVGGAEYVARQNKFLRPSVAPAIEGVRGGIKNIREGILSGVSPEYLDMIGREMLTLDPEKTIWQGGPLEVADAVYGKFVRSIPSTLAVMLPAARLFKAANTAGALTYLGASEGGMSVGSIANNITDEIAAMSHEELLSESERYRAIYQSTGDEVTARQNFTAEAQGAAPLVGGLGVAAISMATGRLLKPVFAGGAEGGLSLGRRVGLGMAEEFPQEGSQGATEQMVQNFAAQIYDDARNLSEGVAEAFVQEGTIGALSGGAMAGAFGQRPDRPLAPPQEDEGGQLTLPGFGPQQAIPDAPEDVPGPEGQYVPNTGMGQQVDMWPATDVTDAVQVPQEQAPGQGVLPLGIAGTESLAERGPDHRNLREGDIPDALDQPTAEPVADLEAQLADLTKANGRSAVYLSPEQRNTPAQLPKGAVVIPNFDGKGGVIIAKDQKAAQYARQRRAQGGSMQAIIGELTMAGTGKPNVKAGYAVQLLGEDGAVARESLVKTKAEAIKLERQWKADGEVRTLSGPEALARRGDAIEREQIDLRTEDPALVAEATGDLLAPLPTALTAAENQSKVTGQQVRMTDDAGNVIVEEEFATPEEAEARTDELSKDFPDAILTSKPVRTKAAPSKAGVSTTNKVPQRQPKGPAKTDQEIVADELRKKLSFDERAEVEDLVGQQSSVKLTAEKLAARGEFDLAEKLDKSIASTYRERAAKKAPPIDEFNPSIGVEDIEDLPTFRVDFPVIDETPQPNKTIAITQRTDSKWFDTRKAAKAYGTRMYNAAVKKAGPDVAVKESKVVAEDSDALESTFQSAVQAKADRKQGMYFPKDREEGKPPTADEASSNTNELISVYRNKNRAPSQKVQFIRRERAAQLRRAEPIKNVRATRTTSNIQGKKGKIDTAPLTYKTTSGEETVAQKTKRVAAVKEAKTRLRFAINRAKKFMDRFDTTGEYGVYVEENTNIDGSLTKEALDFIVAKNAFTELLELANSAIASQNDSNAFATMAKQIAGSLERIKLQSMTPQQFAKEFSSVARTNELQTLRQVPAKFRESASERDTKVKKLNSERHRANERHRIMEGKWKNDRVWNEIIGPLFRKFSDAMLVNASNPASNTYYNPTEFEIENVRYALRTFRKMTARYPADEWYNPIKDQLEHYGFEFDESGDVIVQKFSPSDNLLGSGFIEKHGESKKAADDSGRGSVETPRVIVTPPEEGVGSRIYSVPAAESKPADRTSEIAEQEINENRNAVLNIRRANALIDKFKSVVAGSKTTINGIKRQEQRLIRGLRKLGVWTDTAPGMGRIDIGGFRGRTYRLVGPRLDARSMTKPEAKAFIDRLANFAMPRELVKMANRMNTDPIASGIDEFVEDNSTEFFLESIDLEQNVPALDQAAEAVGDLIRDRNTQANANNVLDAIIENLDENHFYSRLAKKLRSLDMSDLTLQYDWAGVKFTGRKASNLGVYDPNTNRAYLNRTRMEDTLGSMMGARATHTLLHEFLHAATHNAIATNPQLHMHFVELRDAAHDAWVAKNGTANLPAALRKTNRDGAAYPIDEFVAEVFADETVQDFLKSTPYEKTTVWRTIMNYLTRLLGWTNVPNIENMLDAFMAVEDIVFEGAGVARKGSELLNLEAFDTPLREFASKFIERSETTQNILQRVRDGGKNTIFNLTSMEQFAERFKGKFMDGARDLMAEYYDAFRKRNAKAAQYLDRPQKLSHRWTQLEGTNPKEATAISQIGTEASLLTIDPRVSVTDEANAHLGDELHSEHARLHAQYNALSPEAKAIFNEAIQYYNDSLQTETLFLMQSALRGMLATGESSALTPAEFDKRFSIAELKKLESRDDLSDAIGEFFAEEGKRDVLDTIYKMSMLPRKRKGIYMPMMRYGDEVAYAERQRADQIFEDRKEAMAQRKAIVGDDPTLDAQVFENDEGQIVLRVFERAFIMGESVSEVENQKAQMIADRNNDFTEDDFYSTQKRMSKKTEEAIGSNAALTSILNTLQGDKAAQSAIKNFYLRNLSETSFRKHEIKRKNRLGVRYDLQHRNLATYAKQASYYTSQLEFGWKMSKAIRDMRELNKRSKSETARDLSLAVDHLTKRDELGHDLPTRSILASKSIEATHFFMLTSPSYWAINATQPWMVTLPTLAGRHGFGASASAMIQIQRTIFGDLAAEAAKMKGGLAALKKGNRAAVEDTFNIINQIEKRLETEYGADSKEYIELLEYLRENHIIDINVFTEMRDVASGKSQSGWDRTIDASRIMAHLTEVNNRVVTALAAYQLEKNKTGDVAAAREYAGDMVSQTQFNYSAENKPPTFQKYPLVFQFMQWPQHMYAHLIRNYQGMVEAGVMNKSEARTALLGLLGTHAAVGGMVGMMLQPIKWAIGLTLMALGDDDEPYTFANAISGRTYDRLIAEVSADLFGTTASTIISKGLPAGVLGVDLSARMSMGTFYFIDMRGDNAQSVLGSLLASFGGATLNQAVNMSRGIGTFAGGDFLKGVEQASPKIARDALRSYRYYTEGLVNNAGDTVIPASEMGIPDTMRQFFGFSPTRVSNFYSAQNAIKDAEGYAVDRKSELLQRFRTAESASERADIAKEIRSFNRSNPAERITHSSLLRNKEAQRKREASFRRYGANIDEKKARYYERYGRPYRDD